MNGAARIAKVARRLVGPAGVTAVAAGVMAGTTTGRRAPPRSGCGSAAATGPRHRRCSPPSAPSSAWDFIYYWNHRFMHESRLLWAIHVVHHSSERYNLSTALRQPVADALGAFVPMGALSAARLPARADRDGPRREPALPVLDPHRGDPEARPVRGGVQHRRRTTGSTTAATSQYIDRNHGSILIVWDRLFGTFEREDERVVYGLTKNVEHVQPGSHRHPRARRHPPRRRPRRHLARPPRLRVPRARAGPTPATPSATSPSRPRASPDRRGTLPPGFDDPSGERMTTKTAVPAVDGLVHHRGRQPALSAPAAPRAAPTCSRRRRRAFCPNPRCAGQRARPRSSCRRPGTIWSLHRRPLPAAAALRRADRPARAVRHRRGRARPPRASWCWARSSRASASTTCTSATEVELVVDTLFEDDEHEYLVWKWKPTGSEPPMTPIRRRRPRRRACTRGASGAATSSSTASAAARDALADAGVDVADIQFVAGADTMRNGYPGYVAGATFAQALGWTGARVSRRATPPARRAPRPSRPPAPASSPGCATSPSSSAPTPRRRASSPPTPATGPTTPTGCGSGCSAPPTRPTSRSTPAAAWTSTAPPTRTSPRSRSRTPATAWPTPTPGTARR